MNMIRNVSIVSAMLAVVGCGAATVEAPAASTVQAISSDPRAVAYGDLLDTAVAPETVEEGLRIADGLRQVYGVESGNLEADRRAAAQRVVVDVLATQVIEPDRIAAVATELGFDLDPAVCGTYCANVMRLAVIEIQKRTVLELIADAETEG